MPKEAGESQLNKAIRILKDGGLVIAPTETFYGILADARSQKAVHRLARLKERDMGKPIPLIAGDATAAGKAAAVIPPAFIALADEFWPGPLTLVLKAAEGFPAQITAGTGTIGIRVPSPSMALEIAKLHGSPLTATSANRPGLPPPVSTEQLDVELAAAVDLVVDGGTTPGGQPSTVLDITGEQPRVIRIGALGKKVIHFLAKSKIQ